MARVQSVDILRGATIILMIVVNNPGNWALRWAPLRHAVWNGLTLTDLVFPLFLFVMGVSMYFSLSRGGFKLSWKMLRRVLLLIFLGLLLNWGSAALWAHTYSLDTLRFTGVLQRFALCFALTALIVCLLPRKSVPWIALILLVGYSVALLLGNGYAYSPENIIARVDNALIPAKHLYNDNGIDPEGILSTIPSLSHTLIGFMFGELIAKHRNRELMTRAIIGIATGVLISIWLPINKKIWSPSFVLVACGIGALLLGLLYYLTDEKNIWKNAGFFKSFGTNAIYCYVVSHIVGWGFIICGFQRLFAAANSAWISFLYSLVVVMVVWLTVLPLYKKNIYIKV